MTEAKWPRAWLMTDERIGADLFEAIGRLPAGAGIVLRHDSQPLNTRRDLAREVAQCARRRGLVLSVAGDVTLAKEVSAAMVHRPVTDPGALPFSLPVHSLQDAIQANAAGAALGFVSPVRATRSHPGRRPLTREEAHAIVATLQCPVIALGGMDAAHFAHVSAIGFYGWAGIDAWL